MSNSPLVNYTKISPNSTNPRRDKIKKITIHHMAGNLTVETCGNVFASPSRQASSNYGIGSDGRVGMYVEEKNRAWTSSSAANDNQAVTIEVANDQIGGDWHVSDTALNKLIELCVDICKRNGIEKLIYTGDASGNLTRHNMFANTNCPGAYLQSKFPYIAEEVNKRLGATSPNQTSNTDSKVLYRVQTGAFSNKANAVALENKLKTQGFDTYIVQVGNLYKVQVGAFGVKANADAMLAKLKGAGYDAFITTNSKMTVSPTSNKPSLKVGSKVKVIGDRYATGQAVPSWVKNNTYTVQQLSSNKALLKEIVSWVYTKDLKIVG